MRRSEGHFRFAEKTTIQDRSLKSVGDRCRRSWYHDALVSQHHWIEGYRNFSLMHVSFAVSCQSTGFADALRCLFQAPTSRIIVSRSGNPQLRRWLYSTLIPITA